MAASDNSSTPGSMRDRMHSSAAELHVATRAKSSHAKLWQTPVVQSSAEHKFRRAGQAGGGDVEGAPQGSPAASLHAQSCSPSAADAMSHKGDIANRASAEVLVCPCTGEPYSSRAQGNLPMLLSCGHHISAGALQGSSALHPHGSIECPVCQAQSDPSDVRTHNLLVAALQPNAPPVELIKDALQWQWHRADARLASILSTPGLPASGVSTAKIDNTEVIVKRIGPVEEGDAADSALWELAILARVHSPDMRPVQTAFAAPACVRLLGWGLQSGADLAMGELFVCIVSAKAGSSMLAVMDAAQQRSMTLEKAASLAFYTGCALQALHNCGVIHGFVHPAHVVCTAEQDAVLLCGFSNAALMMKQKQGMKVGMAAETVDDSEFCPAEVVKAAEAEEPVASIMTPQADVWGVATIFAFLLTGEQLVNASLLHSLTLSSVNVT